MRGDLYLAFLSAIQASALPLQRSLVSFICKGRKGRKKTMYNNYSGKLFKEESLKGTLLGYHLDSNIHLSEEYTTQFSLELSIFFVKSYLIRKGNE